MDLREIKIAADRVIKELYKEADGITNNVDILPIYERLGLSQEEGEQAIKYLAKKGYVEPVIVLGNEGHPTRAIVTREGFDYGEQLFTDPKDRLRTVLGE